jgi:hypothetical protein
MENKKKKFKLFIIIIIIIILDDDYVDTIVDINIIFFKFSKTHMLRTIMMIILLVNFFTI